MLTGFNERGPKRYNLVVMVKGNVRDSVRNGYVILPTGVSD